MIKILFVPRNIIKYIVGLFTRVKKSDFFQYHTNVWCIKIRSKHITVLLLYLLQNLMH